MSGGPAFPRRAYEEFDGTEVAGAEGMTLRDYFAANAPKPQDDFGWNDGETDSYQRMTRWAYVYADAMLAERAK